MYWNARWRARRQEDWNSPWWPRRKALCQAYAPRCARALLENAPPSDSTPPARTPSAEGPALHQSKRIFLPGWTAYASARPHLGRTAAEDDTRIRRRVAWRNRALSFSENVISIVIVISAPLLRGGGSLPAAAGICPALPDFFPQFLYALCTTNLLTLSSITVTGPNSPPENC
jgi:hypothetical protein